MNRTTPYSIASSTANKSTELRSQQGFTLIELVIVILLLGLLAVTALPRFLDVTDQAQEASLQGVAGGISSGVAIAKAQWVADGNSSGTAGVAVVLDGQTVYANENGWPAKTAAATDAGFASQTAAECLEVWNFILQNPPLATTGAVTNQSYVLSVIDGGGAAGDSCRASLVINGTADANKYFDYNLETGTVIISPTI